MTYNCDPDAYELLKACSLKKDFSDWTAWRQAASLPIALEGADLKGAWLKRVDLSHVHLSHARLDEADLEEANLERSFLNNTSLKNCLLHRCNLKDAQLSGALLDRSNMIDACLLGVRAEYTSLQGTNLHHAALQGANFSYAVVDGSTLLDTEKIDRHTNFTSVGLSSARVKPGLIDTLNDNIRRRRWQEWYTQGHILDRLVKNLAVRPFWWISDYGRSTRRILAVFALLSILASLIYLLAPETLSNLEETNVFSRTYRAIYFSVATMITLGFGNINAQPTSFLGNTTVTLQILSGYLLLAALVTRISVLFTSGGPALETKKDYKKFSKY